MKVTAILLALAGSASAFAPVAKQSSSSQLSASLEGLPGGTAPLTGFDPLGLANIGSDATLKWFQAAELKHGRVAMLATTGYIVQAAGIHFPGQLSSDISFESLVGKNPFEQWDAVPDAGTYQIYIETRLILALFLTSACVAQSFR